LKEKRRREGRRFIDSTTIWFNVPVDRIIDDLDEKFARLHLESLDLMRTVSLESLYRRPSGGASLSVVHSCGDQVLRSAAVVEQTFGGITANLWDDPFEWTLPEALPTPDRVSEYLDEVEATRKRGFELFKSDSDLAREIMSPSGPTQLLPLLLDTLRRAEHYLAGARKTLDLVRAKQLTTDH
jgi:hypothetical protein